MFGLSRLLELAGTVTWELSPRRSRKSASRRHPLRRLGPQVEILEERTVPTLLGNQLFPSNNPWNENISNAPAALNSAQVIANIGPNTPFHPDFGQDTQGSGQLYGIPYNVVNGNSASKVTVMIDDYPGQSDQVGVPVPMPANPVIEGDFQNGPNLNGPGYNTGQRGDSHLIIYDEANNIDYEFYGAARPSDKVDFDGKPTGGAWHAAQETIWNLNTNTFRTLGYTSADAAGLPILPGLIRPDEALPVSQGGQGAINHAIRMTLQNSVILDQYLYPASHIANKNTDATNDPPMGARFRLKASVNISSFPPEAQAIAQAMKTYGLIVADNGSNMYGSGASFSPDANNNFSLTWDDNDIQTALKSLTASDFELVNLTPVITSLSPATAAASSTVTINGLNFSGNAGNLQVLFGSTLSTSVTYVSDSQITAVVPAGSGSVAVRVVSGLTGTAAQDTVNGNKENVLGNAYPGGGPIFGNGVSAIVAADQFTYGTSATLQSITLSPLTPSIAAGLTQQFTATGNYSDGSHQTLTNTVTWSSSSTAAATVSTTGLATGVAVGSTTIKAVSGTVSTSTTLSVTAAVLQSIALSPLTPSIAAGLTQQFTATGNYSDGSHQSLTNSVTWSSSSTPTGTISAGGLATGVAAGSTTIKAVSGTVNASTTLTVTAPALQSITLIPLTPSIAAGGTQQFSATGNYSDGSHQNLTNSVTWSSSSTSAATISAAGLATGVAAGSTTIKAVSGSVSASTSLTVTAPTLQSITLSPLTPSIAAGLTQQFSATGNYSDGSHQNLTSSVTWSSSTTTAATISSTGLATGVAVGSATIKAISGSVSSSTTLTVTPAVLQSITLSPLTPSITVGSTEQFAATGNYSDGSHQNLTNTVSWSSSSTATATVSTTGLATGVAVGSTTIKAVSGSVSASTTLSVTAAALQSITLSPLTPSIAAGLTQQFMATGNYSDGSHQNLTNSVTWSSLSTPTATISSTGLATGAAVGSTTIKAVSGGITGSTTLTVTAAILESIRVTPTGQTLLPGATQQFTATGTYSDNSTKNLTATVTWSSTNTAAATVSSGGLVTAVANGSATIQAISGGVTGSTSVTVTSVSPPSITNQPTNATVAAGQTATFTVTASGAAPLSYQWQKLIGGVWVNISASNTSPFSGATTATFSIISPVATDAGTYWVVVANTGGSVISASATLTVNVPPAAPTNLTLTPGTGQVTLNWTASATASSYNIYRGTSSGGEVLVQSGVTATSYVDSGLTNGTTYFYKVAAVNAGGASPLSGESSATPQVSAPSVPAGVGATGGDGQIRLTWSAVAGATTYNVYRATTTGGEGSTPFLTGITGTTFTDTGLPAGATFFYEVSAVNPGGASAGSAEVSATTNPALSFGSPTLPVGTSGSPYNQAIAVTGGSGTGYQFAVSGGSLPPGLTLSNTGVLSGTPGVAGTSTFSVTVTDSSGGSAQQSESLTVSAPGGSNFDELGAYRSSDGSWSLDSNGQFGFQSGPVAGPAPLADRVMTNFSPAGSNVIPVSGDWTGTGSSKIGDFENGAWHLDLNDNGILDPGETFGFGTAGDVPVPGHYLAGGGIELAVFRSMPQGYGEFLISDPNWLAEAQAGQAIAINTSFIYGAAGDRVVVGDWSGQGLTEVGVFRSAVAFGASNAAVFSLDVGNHHAFDASNRVFIFGTFTDGVVIGDWDGSGTSKVGVYRPATAYGAANTAVFSLDTSGQFQFNASSQVFLFGVPTDKYVTGRWAYVTSSAASGAQVVTGAGLQDPTGPGSVS